MPTTQRSFIEIAEKKGAKISFNESQEIHLDMNMIEASLAMAVENATREGIKARLRALQNSGTDAQKVEFVMGEGEYFFPQDIEMLAKRSKEGVDASGSDSKCVKVCEVTTYVVCRCIRTGPPPGEVDQVCLDKARRICEIVCE